MEAPLLMDKCVFLLRRVAVLMAAGCAAKCVVDSDESEVSGRKDGAMGVGRFLSRRDILYFSVLFVLSSFLKFTNGIVAPVRVVRARFQHFGAVHHTQADHALAHPDRRATQDFPPNH